MTNYENRFRRSALPTTKTLDIDMAKAANIGEREGPPKMASSPIAVGHTTKDASGEIAGPARDASHARFRITMNLISSPVMKKSLPIIFLL